VAGLPTPALIVRGDQGRILDAPAQECCIGRAC